MIFAYIRVSTKQQKIDRQYEEIKELGVDDKHIYIDKESGKDFDRTNYQKLIRKIKKDDELNRSVASIFDIIYIIYTTLPIEY